jgi:osmotically-inducible protein OsmY
MRKKKFGLLLSFLVVVAISTAYTFRSQGQKGSDSKSEVATPVQEGVMTDRQKEHSKLYGSYKGRGRLRDLVQSSGSASKGFTILSGTPELSVRPPDSTSGEMVRDLAARADAVVLGLVTDKASQLTEGGDFIFTDYHLTVEQVLKNNGTGSLRSQSIITITRPGGKVLLDGQVIEVRDRSFKPFALGGRYLLFLKRVPTTGAYRAVNYKASFQINNNKIETLTDAPDGQLVGEDAASFMNDVRIAIADYGNGRSHER